MTLPESTPEYWIRQAQKEKAMCKIDEQVARKLGWDKDTALDAMPLYSTSIEAAWEIVGEHHMRLVHSRKGWWCTFKLKDPSYGAAADTAPLAIALAFLKLP